MGRARAADHAAGAADIVDDHRLPERLAHALGEHAAEHVDRPARRGGHDHAHGVGGKGWPGLRQRASLREAEPHKRGAEGDGCLACGHGRERLRNVDHRFSPQVSNAAWIAPRSDSVSASIGRRTGPPT